MLTPYVSTRGMFDEFFDSAFNGHGSMMRTDIKESDQGYELIVDLPGVKKDQVTAELKDGYLSIGATVDTDSEEKDSGKYLRRERFVGTYRRSFYVGEQVRREDVRARFEDGTLHLFLPKENRVNRVEPHHMIAIDG